MENEGFIGRVRSLLDREPQDPQDVIYKKYQQLKRTPSGFRHAEKYHQLKGLVLENQNALYDLIFSERLDESETHNLLHFGGHGGSVAKEDNLHWAPFIARVRERQDELPESVQSGLDWLKVVHGW